MEWIKLDDKPPEPGVDVLGFNSAGDIIYFIGIGDCPLEFYEPRITHWMPLPPPPNVLQDGELSVEDND